MFIVSLYFPNFVDYDRSEVFNLDDRMQIVGAEHLWEEFEIPPPIAAARTDG
jgi:hypothetical protein